jgi:hypothetical protein
MPPLRIAARTRSHTRAPGSRFAREQKKRSVVLIAKLSAKRLGATLVAGLTWVSLLGACGDDAPQLAIGALGRRVRSAACRLAKACQSLESLGDYEQARASCRAALAKSGVTLDDDLRFVLEKQLGALAAVETW